MKLINLTANKERVNNILSDVKIHTGPCIVRVFKDGVEINPEKKGMKFKFKNYERAKESVEFYKQIYPDLEFEIEENK